MCTKFHVPKLIGNLLGVSLSWIYLEEFEFQYWNLLSNHKGNLLLSPSIPRSPLVILNQIGCISQFIGWFTPNFCNHLLVNVSNKFCSQVQYLPMITVALASIKDWERQMFHQGLYRVYTHWSTLPKQWLATSIPRYPWSRLNHLWWTTNYSIEDREEVL